MLKYGLKLMEKLKQNRGGKRIGSGRKPVLYQTQTIAFRVRNEWVDEIKELVKSKINQLQNDKPIKTQ